MSCEWRPIKDFEGRYEASKCGLIRNCLKGNVLSSPTIHKYPHIRLFRGDGSCRRSPIHLVIAETWLGPRPSPQHICDHIDGNKHNAAVENLEWITKSENMRRAVANNQLPIKKGQNGRGEEGAFSKLTADQVRDIRRLFGTMSQKKLATLYGTTPANVYKIVHRLSWAHIE